jgi:hypothetical protein
VDPVEVTVRLLGRVSEVKNQINSWTVADAPLAPVDWKCGVVEYV